MSRSKIVQLRVEYLDVVVAFGTRVGEETADGGGDDVVEGVRVSDVEEPDAGRTRVSNPERESAGLNLVRFQISTRNLLLICSRLALTGNCQLKV